MKVTKVHKKFRDRVTHDPIYIEMRKRCARTRICMEFEVFKCYLTIKLHFTTDTYDYEEYGGKVNCKLETFTKRNDRYFFHKLSKQYDQKNIVDFFVANFVHTTIKKRKLITK